jgi:hypothetical protein
MINTLQNLLPYGILASHVLFILIFITLLFRKGWGTKGAEWIGRHSIKLALVVALASISGSLFYSVGGRESCFTHS